MKKRLISMLLLLVMALGLLPNAAFAASTEEEALGEVGIYNGGYELSYLSINGTVRTQIYTYFRYADATGVQKEVPAYCVNPNTKGVPQTVAAGESIKYIANEKSSDPKVVGIISNGYPHRSLGELKLDNKYQAYYATKMALWCYLLPNWNIANLKVNPSLTGSELDIANRILAAAKDIYKRGTTYNYMLSPKMTATPDKSVAYPVTVDGKAYKQQVFTLWSETWVYDYDISVAFSDPGEVPSGTRIVDENNNDITKVSAQWVGDGYGASFKVLYPAESVKGQSGNVQLSFEANVAQYAAMYAVCAEKDKYGNLQNYICDLDNSKHMELAAISSYADTTEDEPDPGKTALKIVKLEEGTELPLDGAVFSVYDPRGEKVGSFSSTPDGTVTIPLTLEGHYTVTEEIPPKYHLLPDVRTQHVEVEYNRVATVTFTDAPYGSIRVQKLSDTGEALNGVTVQIKNITTGEVRTAQTKIGGVAVFDELEPGGWEVKEVAGISGWIADTDTVQTIAVVAGKCSDATIINKELPGLRLTKYERGTMTLMPDVSFEIFRDAESLGIFQTDEFGQILLTDCKPGTYRAEERDTGGDGHVLDTTPQEVELHAGDGIKDLVFFNDRLPGIHLIKVDSSDLSKPIANARFKFEATNGSYGPVELTTGQDGTIDLSKLPVASYVVTELECPGYVVDDAQRIIHLDGNEQAQFVFTNSKLPSLYLYKESADGTPLAGVTYRLAKIEDGSRYLDRTTSGTGEIVWEGLDPGVYSLVETATVSDHLLDPTEYHVELFAGRDSTICLQNDKRPNLTIYKYDADDHTTPVPGTTFLVEAADGHSVAEVEIGPDGSATVPNLWPGVFKISEQSVGSSAYLMDAPDQYVTLFPNRDRAAYFYDHKAPVIEIIKENSITHDRLSNVRFQVWYASNNTSTGEFNDLGIFTTDENGRIELTGPANGLRDGWFRVKELAPPTGYSIKDSDTQEAFVQAGKGHTFLVENTPLSALVVYKRDSVTGAGLSNCLFQLSYLGGDTSGSGGTVIGTYQTSQNGSFTVTGLKAGYYICEELESDSGHIIDSAPQSFYISGKNQDIVTLYFSNAPLGSLLVKKVSASDNAPLSDVEFFVTTADGTVVGDNNGKFVTGSDGTFLVSNIEPGTVLVVSETRAKPGYLKDDASQTATIQAGKCVSLEFRNQLLGNLIIEKWGRNGTKTVPLEGVKFEIKYADGRYVDAAGGTLSSNGIYYTNSSGQIILSGITGTVVATELESVDGYTIDPNTQSQVVTINPNDTQTIRFYNDVVGGVEIIKANEADKTERIPNTTFEIRRVSDDALVKTVTTGKTGSVFVTLEDDSYYAVETESAEGFKLDATPHYFTVSDGSSSPLVVTNRACSGIKIHKTDKTTGKGIYGVSFILYDASHNPIDQQTTDDRGYAWFEDLPGSGRYYLRELENEGYIADTELKTVYAKAGSTTLVEWENIPITAQIQIVKKSADYNPTTGLPAGTLLEGAVFEITDKAGNLVDTIRSDSRGLAVSKPLPLSRYTIREVKAPEHYGVNETELTAYLEHEGQIVRFEVTNKSLSTGVSITKTGPKEIMAGQPVRYVFSNIANSSNVRLDSFYWRDTLPAQVRLETVVTGTWNFPGTYKIVYRVNGGDYRTLADNLSTSKNYTLAASATALGLASNEQVTEVMFVFGQAPAGFAQVETPYLYCRAVANLPAGSFVNVADVGGVYNGTWVQAVSRWVTQVYGKPVTPSLPRTGY